jgi:hypothetical protein
VLVFGPLLSVVSILKYISPTVPNTTNIVKNPYLYSICIIWIIEFCTKVAKR